VQVFIHEDNNLTCVKGDKSRHVEHQRFNHAWLNTEFPIRPALSTEELAHRRALLIEWDHSFAYRTSEQRYVPTERKPFFTQAFPWVAVMPELFEVY
jgi:hypothetical protein